MQGQSELGTHFMNHLAQSNLINPSTFSPFDVSLNLPSVYAGSYNSSFKFSDALTQNGRVLRLNFDDLSSSIDKSGFTAQGDLNVETFGLSIQTKKLLISVNHGVRMHSLIHLPKDAVDYFLDGNAKFIDQTANLAIQENGLAYHEIGLGLAYKFSDKLTIGARLKYLNGIATIRTSRTKVEVYTDPEYYQFSAETDYQIQTGGLPSGDFAEAEFLDFDEIDFEFFGDNTGFAVDLGVTYEITDKFLVQASLKNIGKINWEKDAHVYTSKGSFTFAGLDLEPILDDEDIDFDQILDTLENTFNFERQAATFSTPIPSAFYLSGTYEIAKKLYGSLLFFTQKNQVNYTSAVAANLKKDLGRVLTLGVQYGYQSGGAHNVGLMTSLRLGPIQVYAITDNALPLLNPLETQNINLRTGVNLVFGNKERRKRKREKRARKEALDGQSEIIEVPDSTTTSSK